MIVPLGGDVITPEAAASLVGQTVRLNVVGRWDQPLGRAIVADAEPTNVGLRLVLDVPVSVYERIVGRFGPVSWDEWVGRYRFRVPEDLSYGLGFRVDASEITDPDVDPPRRRFTAVTPYEVSVHHPPVVARPEADS